MKIRLRAEMSAALPLIRKLDEHGHEAVFVGGSVRDTVLGLPTNDIDIATSALPEQMLNLFPHCIPTGLKHGTVTVVHNGIAYELTTYREEAQYEQYRKPKEVTFITELDHDLLRRDFTMNAMAIREDGELYDPCGGQQDLRLSILRCVGEADQRFQEDALRMARAVRFLGTYRLKPALSVWRSLKRHRQLLKHVAMERVMAELDKMMTSDSPTRSMAWLASSGLLPHLKESLPDLNLQCARGNEFAELDVLAERDERWSAILLSIGCSVTDAFRVMTALKFSNKRSALIISVLKIHEAMKPLLTSLNPDPGNLLSDWRENVLIFGEVSAAHWLRVAEALQLGNETLTKDLCCMLQSHMESMPVKTIKDLNIGGAELQRGLDRKGGPWLAIMLNRLLRAAAAGQIVNKKEQLLEQAIIWNDEGK